MRKKIAVIGAGNGGFAVTADLGLAGFDIHLYEFPEFNDNIAPIRDGEPIHIIGDAREGSFAPSLVTDDINAAVEGVASILVVTQATAHERLINLLGKSVRPEQFIFLFSGYAGSVLMVKVLSEKYNLPNIKCADIMTLPYACRKSGPNEVNVFRRTGVLGLVAFPAKHTAEMFSLFQEMYPACYQADNVLQLGLCNQNLLLHPAITLMNTGGIESDGGEFNFYADGCTPSVEVIIEALDHEILAVFKKLGFPPESSKQACERRFEMPWVEIQKLRKSWTIKGFDSVNTRFITEDVPTGLVFLSSVAKYCSVATPTCDALIHLCEVMLGKDYRAEGRTIEKLGLAHILPEKLNDFLQLGSV